MKFRLLKANEIDARIATISEKGCSLLLYKDARVDQNILDETVGPENWQREHEVVGQNLYCTVKIWDEFKGQWIAKQDVGTESYTEKEKGQASDSFKRACFNWGIGRELYTAPFIWVKAGDVNIEEKQGRKTTYDTFKVKTIGYDDQRNIVQLEIVNSKTHKVVYSLGKAPVEAKTDEQLMDEALQDKISKKDVEVLKNVMERKGVSATGYRGKKLEKLTSEEYGQALRELNEMPDKESA